MPLGAEILFVSAVCVALGVVFKSLQGFRRWLRMMDRLTVLLTEMTEQLGGTPSAFEILEQIIAQFRTDSGSSLRDQINDITKLIAVLTDAARQNEQLARLLEDRVEAVRTLSRDERRESVQDQARMQREQDRMMRLLQRLEIIVAAGAETGLRMELAAHGVADDLAERDARADAVEAGEPGEAADAAAKPPSD